MNDDSKSDPNEAEFLDLLARVPADEREEVIAKLKAVIAPVSATEIDAERSAV